MVSRIEWSDVEATARGYVYPDETNQAGPLGPRDLTPGVNGISVGREHVVS
jgi:hypothetical protein